MNAKKTISRLKKELETVTAQLIEERKPGKFLLVPVKARNESEEHYWRVTYFQYSEHNRKQKALVNRLNSMANDLTAQICRIKSMNAIQRFFID